MDIDLLSQAENLLSEAVDNRIADWEDGNPKLMEALAGQWLVDHSNGTMYPDQYVEADFEEAYTEVTSTVIGQMIRNWGWVRQVHAERWYRICFVAGVVLGAAFVFIIGRM